MATHIKNESLSLLRAVARGSLDPRAAERQLLRFARNHQLQWAEDLGQQVEGLRQVKSPRKDQDLGAGKQTPKAVSNTGPVTAEDLPVWGHLIDYGRAQLVEGLRQLGWFCDVDQTHSLAEMKQQLGGTDQARSWLELTVSFLIQTSDLIAVLDGEHPPTQAEATPLRLNPASDLDRQSMQSPRELAAQLGEHDARLRAWFHLQDMMFQGLVSLLLPTEDEEQQVDLRAEAAFLAMFDTRAVVLSQAGSSGEASASATSNET